MKKNNIRVMQLVEYQRRRSRKGMIPVEEMKDGDIARIERWHAPEYEGRVVQRWGKHLVTLGSKKKRSWSNFFKQRRPHDLDLKVILIDIVEIVEIDI